MFSETGWKSLNMTKWQQSVQNLVLFPQKRLGNQWQSYHRALGWVAGGHSHREPGMVDGISPSRRWTGRPSLPSPWSDSNRWHQHTWLFAERWSPALSVRHDTYLGPYGMDCGQGLWVARSQGAISAVPESRAVFLWFSRIICGHSPAAPLAWQVHPACCCCGLPPKLGFAQPPRSCFPWSCGQHLSLPAQLLVALPSPPTWKLDLPPERWWQCCWGWPSGQGGWGLSH